MDFVHQAPSYVIEAVGTLLATYFMEIMWVVAISMADPFGFDSCDFPIDKDWNTSEQVMMQQVCPVLCCVFLCDAVMSCHVMSCHVALCCMAPCHVCCAVLLRGCDIKSVTWFNCPRSQSATPHCRMLRGVFLVACATINCPHHKVQEKRCAWGSRRAWESIWHHLFRRQVFFCLTFSGCQKVFSAVFSGIGSILHENMSRYCGIGNAQNAFWQKKRWPKFHLD